MRSDLLALTLDDLAVLTNRGIVNRAKKELEQFSFELSGESAIVVKWSDQVECILPLDEAFSDRHCSCSATTVCRHLIRSVLAYQQARSFTPQPWNPGNISDEELAEYFTAAQLKRVRQQFETDQVIEVQCGTKPIAHLHSLAHTLKFLVPNDLRYTHCDCAEPAPCQHVPIAVWAFRQASSGMIPYPVDRELQQISDPPQSPLTEGGSKILAPSPYQGEGWGGVEDLHRLQAKLISTEQKLDPPQLLHDIESALDQLLQSGLNHLNLTLIGKFQRFEQQCRALHLVWFAEVLAELLQCFDRYQNHDALFSPQQVVALMAELCIRSDALCSGKIPRLFVAGSKHDRTTELGTARLIGLGCGVQIKQKTTTLTSYFQDANTGMITAFSKDFNGSDAFSHLAQKPVLFQHSFTDLGSGQLLIQRAKRSPNFRLILGRSAIALNPQSFQWEQLRSPLLIEDFAEFPSHLPPEPLRPRRVTENLHVFAIDKVTSVEFSPIEQAVTAVVWDAQKNAARLKFPYSDRAKSGTEALLNQLTEFPLRFVSGHVAQRNDQFMIAPIGLVFESYKARSMLQPWIDGTSEDLTVRTEVGTIELDPIDAYLERVLNAIANLVLLGIERSTAEPWHELKEQGEKLGFRVLLAAIEDVIAQFADQNLGDLSRSILKLAVLHQLVVVTR